MMIFWLSSDGREFSFSLRKENGREEPGELPPLLCLGAIVLLLLRGQARSRLSKKTELSQEINLHKTNSESQTLILNTPESLSASGHHAPPALIRTRHTNS